jgi:5'-AMP-activated protein kinase regulatory beta subunit
VCGADYGGAAGWPAQPKLVPVVLAWSHGGAHVEVEGSWDNWTARQPLRHTGKDWTIIKLLPPGVYQYKFIVDGEWRYDFNQPAMHDEMANVNNVVEVQEYAPENLDNVSGFDPPPSPPSSYISAPPLPDDFAKEPPLAPPHLQLTLLNVPPAEGSASLPRPQHVVLGHAYLQRGQGAAALVVGTTHRYRGKYVTSVLYKPSHRRRRPNNAAEGAGGGGGEGGGMGMAAAAAAAHQHHQQQQQQQLFPAH